MKTINIIDNGCDRYTIKSDCYCLGRRWDNLAEQINVIKPKHEENNICTMIVSADGVIIEHIVIGNEPEYITNVLSRYPEVEISFTFTNESGYVKNSEIKYFYFEEGRKPEDYVPVEPEFTGTLDIIFKKGFVNTDAQGNMLRFYNAKGEIVSSVEISGLSGGKIDSISVNGVEQTIDENKNVDLKVIEEEIDPSVPSYVKAITQEDINSWNNKAETNDIPSIEGLATETMVAHQSKRAVELSQEYTDNQISSLNSEITNKVDKVEGKDLSTNDYTTEEKNKLSGLSNYDDTQLVNRIAQNENNIISLQNNKANVSDIPTDYVSQSELNSKGYITASEVDSKDTTTLNNAKSYTDTKIAGLVGTAPETLNTLEEVAQAIKNNDTVVEALNSAISSKADDSRVNEISTRVDSLSLRVDDLDYDKADKSSLNTTNANVESLTTRVTNVENNKADMSELITRTGSLGLRITDVEVDKADKSSLRETNTNLENLMTRVTNVENNKANIVYGWETPEYEVGEGQLIYTDGFTATHAPGKYAKLSNVSIYDKLKVSGYQWDTNYFALCMFYDNSNKLISSVFLTANTFYQDYEVDVPENAVIFVINGRKNNAISIEGNKKYDISTLIDEKANRITEWAKISGTITKGQLISNSGSTDSFGNGQNIAINDIDKYKKIYVENGYQWAKEYYSMCMFFDASGVLVSSYSGETVNTRYTVELNVPATAKKLVVNSHISVGDIVVSGYKTYDIKDLYDELHPKSKKLITLGDSITALGTGTTGWVKYFIEKTNCELIANVAVNGAWLNDKDGTVYDGNPVFNGADDNVNNVLGNQVQKIINNNYEAPDIILIAIGTNNGISITKEQMKAVYYDENEALIPLENVDRKTSAGAYRWCLDKLHETYPNAIIFWCTPILAEQTKRSAERITAYAESLRIATEYTGQIMIDTIRCGINGINEFNNANGEYLIDGLHPNINGAKKIGYYNASKVLPFINNNFELST